MKTSTLLTMFIQLDVPTGFMLESEEFQISLKPLPSKVRMLFAHLWLFFFFYFYSALLALARVLTWCTRDNPIRAAPAQKDFRDL